MEAIIWLAGGNTVARCWLLVASYPSLASDHRIDRVHGRPLRWGPVEGAAGPYEALLRHKAHQTDAAPLHRNSVHRGERDGCIQGIHRRLRGTRAEAAGDQGEGVGAHGVKVVEGLGAMAEVPTFHKART